MAISKETVEYVARLARMRLEPEELTRLAEELKNILAFIDKLSQLDVSRVPPTSHILPVNNVLREDSFRGPLSCQKALENAPQKEASFFVVPKVIE